MEIKSKCNDCVWFDVDECTHLDEICDYKKVALPEGYEKLL